MASDILWALEAASAAACACRDKQDEARKIFGIVLNGFGEAMTPRDNDRRRVCPAMAARICPARQGDFSHAAGGVFGGHAFPGRMVAEESFALRESHGVRGDGADVGERGASGADEVMLDRQDGFGDDL